LPKYVFFCRTRHEVYPFVPRLRFVSLVIGSATLAKFVKANRVASSVAVIFSNLATPALAGTMLLYALIVKVITSPLRTNAPS